MASKNLTANETHFKTVHLYRLEGYDDSITLEDNTFGDITFELFRGSGIKRIGSNAFNKTANKLQSFYCDGCDIDNEPPKYDIYKVEIMQFENKILTHFSALNVK